MSMPVSGYDPDDLDDVLESSLTDRDIKEFLTDDEWSAYKRGDESLLDLLEGAEIEQLLNRVDEPSA